MSVCSLVRFEDHSPFNWFINFNLIERLSDGDGAFSSDSKENRVGAVRTNEHPSCFRVDVVESQAMEHCIHSTNGVKIYSPDRPNEFGCSICNYFEIIISAEVRA